jgi:SWI/SNF-related matrix-associated actin-dependent regulator 1 of chromatin subfamily A
MGENDFIFHVKCDRIRKTMGYTLQFPYNQQLIDNIKSLEKELRSFDSKTKLWEVKVKGLAVLLRLYKSSNKIYFDFGQGRDEFRLLLDKVIKQEQEKELAIKLLEENKRAWLEFKDELENDYQSYSDKVHENLRNNIKLYPHQVVVTMFTDKIRNILIAHEMGLGKTLSAIAYVEMNNFDKVIVVTPNSLKFNFYYEVEKFTTSKAFVVGWNKNVYSLEESKYVIINYEFFNPSSKEKFKAKWEKLNIKVIDCLIADECQKIKNIGSNTSINFTKLFDNKLFRMNKPSKVFLSGTPAPNRNYELFNVLNQISPLDFPTKTQFYEYYCGMVYDFSGYGYEFKPEKARFEELYHKISPFSHRRKKEDVLNLPEKIHQKVIMEMDSKEEKRYKELEKGAALDIIESMNGGKVFNHLVILGNLRQYLAEIKIPVLLDMVNDILTNTNEKIIIVDVYKNSLHQIKEKLGDCAVLHTGDFSVEDRSDMVKKFQDPDSNIRVFLGTIATCNYGLTLTASSSLFILTLPFVPGEFDQVIARLHRIGQKNIINIYSLMFSDTIDVETYSRLQDKLGELSITMDNEKHVDDSVSSVIGDVIKKLTSKYNK